jgi:hypothetical protein
LFEFAKQTLWLVCLMRNINERNRSEREWEEMKLFSHLAHQRNRREGLNQGGSHNMCLIVNVKRKR